MYKGAIELLGMIECGRAADKALLDALVLVEAASKPGASGLLAVVLAVDPKYSTSEIRSRIIRRRA
jgi:hypothetical protein